MIDTMRQKKGIDTYRKCSINKSNISNLQQDIIFKINENIKILEELSKLDKLFKNNIDLINKYEYFKMQINSITDLHSICEINTLPKISKETLNKQPKVGWSKKKQKKEESINLREKFENNSNIILERLSELERKQYNIEKERYESIRCFIIRKMFIYYMIHLAEIIKNEEKEDLKALTYDIVKNVDKMKNDDNWILGNNEIKKYLLENNVDVSIKENRNIDELIIEKNNILGSINKVSNDIRFIVKLQSESNIKYRLENDEDLKKMISKIDDILFEFIDFYDGKNDINLYLNKLEEIKKVFKLLGFEYKGIKSEEYHGQADAQSLDLDLCETLDVVKVGIENIEKDFMIRKVYRDAIVKYENNEEKVIKKALVSLYRLSLED